jgi:STE24 endopeptidase
MVNACMTGVVRPLRYVFLTDTLLRDFHPAQVDAIFAHELGHARYWHVPFYFLVALGGGMVLMAVTPLVARLGWPQELGGALIALPYWGLFFGTLSRRFEWQSDLLGARMVICPGETDPMACSVHHPQAKTEEGTICPYQAWAFTSALSRIAAMNGSTPAARSWRHGSIAKRIQRISDLINHPLAVRQFDQRLWTFKALFFLGLVFLGILIYFGWRVGWFYGL